MSVGSRKIKEKENKMGHLVNPTSMRIGVSRS